MNLILLVITMTGLSLNAEDLHCIVDMELPHPGSISRGVRGRLDVSFVVSSEGRPQLMSFKAANIPDVLNSTRVDKDAEQRIMEIQVRSYLEDAEYSKGCAGESVSLHFVFGVLDGAPPREIWSGVFRFRPPNTFVFLTTQGMPEKLHDSHAEEIIRFEEKKNRMHLPSDSLLEVSRSYRQRVLRTGPKW